MAGTPLSRGAYERLHAELEDLTTRGRVQIAQTIEKARALGDLSENGDYHAAKDDQGKMEARIRQLQQLLETAEIVEESGGGDLVAAGSVVGIRYVGDDEVERYLLGSIEERRDDIAVISPGSPLGVALIGKSKGDKVSYEAPSGMLEVEIVEVGA
ncbi:MAG TPA: transcription elongation factor GreA [Acidimicrobiales bacterium]|nr:transcription elongation factor GreA [Acidimicrobiales bacterium]